MNDDEDYDVEVLNTRVSLLPCFCTRLYTHSCGGVVYVGIGNACFGALCACRSVRIVVEGRTLAIRARGDSRLFFCREGDLV